jgi:hypothetical protein
MPSLQELEERRAFECRLTPDRALESLDEAEEFLHDRGLLTRSADCALPSLFEAMHEEPYAPGTGGFGEWPRTKYPWSFDLVEREGVYTASIHRGRTVYMSKEVAALADPICRAEIARMEEADPRWQRLLGHLADAGPSLVEDIRTELELKPRELKSLRGPLERCGAIVGRLVFVETNGGHSHTGELARWDQVFKGRDDPDPSLDELVVAGVRAAVLVPEQEPRRWFSWTWRWEDGLIDRLVAEGRLERPAAGWLSAP